jgi:hypothetical protein
MKKLFSKTVTFAIVFAIVNLFFVNNSLGQISIITLPYNPSTTNFNSYNPNNATNLAATIPNGWSASSSATPVYNGQATGTSATGGYWAYGAAGSGEYSLGALRSGSGGGALNITYSVSFVNNTGATITSLTLAWDYEQWKYNNTSGWDCSGTGSLAGNSTLNGKDFIGSSSGTNGTVSVTGVTSFTLSGLSIANGATFGISWVTTDQPSGDNGIALDNFSISACNTPSITCPAGTSENASGGSGL